MGEIKPSATIVRTPPVESSKTKTCNGSEHKSRLFLNISVPVKGETTCVRKTDPNVKLAEVDVPHLEIGRVVVHKTFGDGIVVKINEVRNRIRVSFNAGEKVLRLPDAFTRKYLTLKQ